VSIGPNVQEGRLTVTGTVTRTDGAARSRTMIVARPSAFPIGSPLAGSIATIVVSELS
jgi:hypothetical protein